MFVNNQSADHRQTARQGSSFFWLWTVLLGLLAPDMVAAQIEAAAANESGLTGITQVQFGGEIQIYSVEIFDAGTATTVELGKLLPGPLNTGIQLTISDLTTPTGLVSADFTELRLYRSTDAVLDGSDTFMASAAPVNIGATTQLDATGAGASRLVPDGASIFFIISARISSAATAYHAFRVGAAVNHIGVEETCCGGFRGLIGAQVLADNANHIVFGGGPAKTTDGAAVTIPFGGEKAMLLLLVSSGAYVLRRRT